MAIDWKKWGVVGYKDNTGIGRMAEDVKRLLGVIHLVVPSERLETHALVSCDRLLRPACSVSDLRRTLTGLHGIIMIERHSWHPELIRTAKALGVKVVSVPMWEWFRGQDENWRGVDLFICPNQFALRVVRSYGYKKSMHLPWLIDLNQLPQRTICGPARLFIHNAGIVDADDRKGTRDTITAFKRVKRSDIRLVVRLQKPAELPIPDERIEIRIGNLPVPAHLYREGDVAIQPSKMEGIGFMVLEPVCSGMPVITLDYPPMNEYVTQPEMLVRKKWFKRKAFPTTVAGIQHAHLRLPSIRDLTRKIEWCADHDMGNFSRANRAWTERELSAAVLKEKWTAALESLS